MPKKNYEVQFNVFFYAEPYVEGLCALNMFFCYM